MSSIRRIEAQRPLSLRSIFLLGGIALALIAARSDTFKNNFLAWISGLQSYEIPTETYYRGDAQQLVIHPKDPRELTDFDLLRRKTLVNPWNRSDRHVIDRITSRNEKSFEMDATNPGKIQNYRCTVRNEDIV